MTGADLLARIEDWMKGNEASWQEAVFQVVDNEYGLEGPWPEVPLAVAKEESPDLPPSPETVDLIAALRASVAASPARITTEEINRIAAGKCSCPPLESGHRPDPLPGERLYCLRCGGVISPSRFAPTEAPPGSRIGQFLDLRAPMERPEGFLRHRENPSGSACLFCDELAVDKPYGGAGWATPHCSATVPQLDRKIGKVAARREELLSGSHLAVSFDTLLTRLRNRRDAIVLASVPEPQTRAGEDLRAPEE